MFSFNASTYLMVKFLSCSSMWGDMISSLHLWSLPFLDKSSFNLAKCSRCWPTSSRWSAVYSTAGAMDAKQTSPCGKVLLRWPSIRSTSYNKYTVPRNLKLLVCCSNCISIFFETREVFGGMIHNPRKLLLLLFPLINTDFCMPSGIAFLAFSYLCC